MSEIGLYIRSIRQQRGADITEFARELGVSPDYLRNLESGRTQTIQLEVINKLQNEFYSIENDLDMDYDPYDPVRIRIDRLAASLQSLHAVDPQAADYLMRIVEQGLDLMLVSRRGGAEPEERFVVKPI